MGYNAAREGDNATCNEGNVACDEGNAVRDAANRNRTHALIRTPARSRAPCGGGGNVVS